MVCQCQRLCCRLINPARTNAQQTDFTVDIAVKYIYRGYTAVTRHLPKVALLFVAASLGVSNSGGL